MRSFDVFFNGSLHAAEENLTAAKSHWEKSGKPYPAEFICHDVETVRANHLLNKIPDLPFVDIKEPLKNTIDPSKNFDVVVCFNGMQNSFVAKDQAVRFLESATCRLKRGGYFIGILPDSSAIW
jgi:hypothetical protein